MGLYAISQYIFYFMLKLEISLYNEGVKRGDKNDERPWRPHPHIPFHTHTDMHMDTHMHTHMHTHAHTHTHTRMHAPR